MNREEKAAVVSDLSNRLDSAKIAIVADYKGLTVASFQELRRELRKNNAEIRVAKTHFCVELLMAHHLMLYWIIFRVPML